MNNGQCIPISRGSVSDGTSDLTQSEVQSAVYNALTDYGASKISTFDLDSLADSIGSDIEKLGDDLIAEMPSNTCVCPVTCGKYKDGDNWKCFCNGEIKDCGSSLAFGDDDLEESEDFDILTKIKDYSTTAIDESDDYSISNNDPCPSFEDVVVSVDINIPFYGELKDDLVLVDSDTMDELPYSDIEKILYLMSSIFMFFRVIRS